MIVKGSVVRSGAGHDSGTFYAVVETDGVFAWIADGRHRRIEKPKKKNLRHLKPTKTQLPEQELTTNNQLWKALSEWNHGDEPTNGEVFACRKMM